MSSNRINRVGGGWAARFRGVIALAALCWCAAAARAQVTVETIGGGPRTQCGATAGFKSGNTWTAAQFNLPIATALDSQNDLWVADFNNADVEEVTQAGNRTSSLTYEYASGSNKHPFTNVVAVALDSANDLYVLTTTTLYKFDNVTISFPSLNLLLEVPLGSIATGSATAMTVVNDTQTNIYISFTNSVAGSIVRIPQPFAGTFSTIVNNYSFAPSGLSMRADGQLGITDTRNSGIYVVSTNASTTPTLITGGLGAGFVNGAPGFAKFNQPHGIAASGDGRMVVCDTMNNYVRVIDTTNNTTTLYGTSSNVWTSTCCSCNPALYSGWVDGAAGTTTSNAVSRQPVSVTISPDGTVYVTDGYYSLIRAVSGSGLSPVTTIASGGGTTNFPSVTTLAATGVTTNGALLNASVDPNGNITTVFFEYGTNTSYGSNTTSVVVSTNLTASNSVSVLLTNLPLGVAIHFQAVAINSAGTTYGGDRVFITSTVTSSGLTISPASGYFPECTTISVTSSVPNVYYTEDGSTPTTNSPAVLITLTNSAGLYVGSFQWCNSTEDLRSLQVAGYASGVVVVSVVGSAAPTNDIGFANSPLVSAGYNTMAYVPLVLNLQAGAEVKSLQFRVEVTPTSGAVPPIASLTLLPVSSNDFIPFASPSSGGSNVEFQATSYTTASNGQGLLVYTLGPDSGLDVLSFAVIGLLQIEIPPTATIGQTYTLDVLYPSATSDGYQASVPLTSAAQQLLTVADRPYLAGDSSPSFGYNAEEFGDGILNNSDVNNAIYASMGVRVPPYYSDIYNAMDAWPPETGDGLIQYQDWNHILLRSVGLESPNWIRYWTNGGYMVATPTTNGLPGAPAVPTDAAVPQIPPGQVWLCPASVTAGTLTNVAPGAACSIPVYANVLSNYSLAGFQFRAVVTPTGSAPAIASVNFSPAVGVPAPLSLPGLGSNDILNAWALGEFAKPLKASNYIGTINFTIPSTAQTGQSYQVHFLGVDGAPDTNTDYQMESFPGVVWVGSAALQPASLTSDEWKMNFFGSLTAATAADNYDADGDGAANWQEYLAGTDPTNPSSALRFATAASTTNSAMTLAWLTAPGKKYVIETISGLGGGGWTAINTNTGDGNTYQFIQNKFNGTAQFYRIRLQP